MNRTSQGFFSSLLRFLCKKNSPAAASLQIEALEGRLLLDVGLFPSLDQNTLEQTIQQLPDQPVPDDPPPGLGLGQFQALSASSPGTWSGTSSGPGSSSQDSLHDHDDFDDDDDHTNVYNVNVPVTNNPVGPLNTYLVSTDDPGRLTLSNGVVVDYDDSDILALVVDSRGRLVNAGIYFDGSDVGLTTGKEDIKGFTLDDQGNIYITLKGKGTVTTPRGNLVVGVNDILKFTPTSLGTTTAGTWDWYFDGSDVGLFGSDERISGLSFLSNGDLLLTLHERGNVPGLGSVQAGDVLRFSFTTQGFGTTAGTWSRWLSGATLGLTGHDAEMSALWVSADGNRVGFSAEDDYRHGNWRAQDEDLLIYNRSTGAVSVLLNTTRLGLGHQDVDGLHILSGDALAALGNTGSGSSTGTGSGSGSGSGSGGGTGSGSGSGSGNSTTPTPNGPLTTYLLSTDDPGALRLPDGSVFTYDDSDIIALVVDSTGQLISAGMYFDGSDVGLTTDKEDIKAFALDAQGNIYVTLKGKGLITTPRGNLVVGVNDILKFTPTSLGATTAGTWDWFFDGSDVGLFGSDERIEGLSFLPNGDLLLSIHEQGSVPGVGSVQAGDLLQFRFTTQGFGTTAGTWSRWLGASTLGFGPSEAELNALWLSGDANRVVFSADDDYRRGGWRAQDEDLLMYNRSTGAVSVLLNTTAMGMRSQDVDGLHILSGDALAGIGSSGGNGGTSGALRLLAARSLNSADEQSNRQGHDSRDPDLRSSADDLLPRIDDSLLDDYPTQQTSPLTGTLDDRHPTSSDLLPQIDDSLLDDHPTQQTSPLTGTLDDRHPTSSDLLPQIDDSLLDDHPTQQTSPLTGSVNDLHSQIWDDQSTGQHTSSFDDIQQTDSYRLVDDSPRQFWRTDDDSLRRLGQAADDALAGIGELDYYEILARRISAQLR